mgnify:CR=1 FL=1
MKRQKNKPKGKASKNSKEAMTLVDCYYIPTAIAEHFCLLREHCATEVEQTLLQLFAKVQREQREDIGEVIVAYDEAGTCHGEISLSPTEISKLEKEIYIDENLTIDDLDIEKIKELKSLEPFGEENPEPIIMYENVEINGIRTLSENKHLKLSLKKNDKIIDAIGFNLGELAEKCKIGDTIDIVGNIEINSFNGKDLIQIRLIDIRKA